MKEVIRVRRTRTLIAIAWVLTLWPLQFIMRILWKKLVGGQIVDESTYNEKHDEKHSEKHSEKHGDKKSN